MTKSQTLGSRLAQKRREKAAREHRDIQQIDVAKAVGVSKASVSRYENDVDTPRDATLERLAKFLDTTPAFLRYGVEEGGASPKTATGYTKLSSVDKAAKKKNA